VKTFTDNAERSWNVEINVAAVKRVRDLAGVDLLEIVEGKLIQKLISDPVLLCDIIYVVCKPLADERSISDEDFGRAMAGDAIEHATSALLEELVSFCPSPRDRKNLGQVLEKTNRVMDKARDLIEEKLETIEVDQVVEEAVRQIEDEPAPESAGDSSGSAPASSASIRAP